MDLVDFSIALTQATRMGTEDLVLPDGRGARGRMTADATEESRSGGESRTQSRRRLEVQAALLVDVSRRFFASARGVMGSVTSDTACASRDSQRSCRRALRTEISRRRLSMSIGTVHRSSMDGL